VLKIAKKYKKVYLCFVSKISKPLELTTAVSTRLLRATSLASLIALLVRRLGGRWKKKCKESRSRVAASDEKAHQEQGECKIVNNYFTFSLIRRKKAQPSLSCCCSLLPLTLLGLSSSVFLKTSDIIQLSDTRR